MSLPHESTIADNAGPDGIGVRAATPADLDALIGVCRLSFPDSLRWQGPGWIAARHWRRWLDSPFCSCWVCGSDETIWGFTVVVLDCSRYNAAAGMRRAERLEAALGALWRPKLAVRKMVRRLTRRRPEPRSDDPTRDAHCDPQKCAWIELIAVRPDMQGRGFGAMMLSHCTSTARAWGYETVKLRVDRDNARALKVYRKAGFTITTEQTDAFTCTYRLP